MLHNEQVEHGGGGGLLVQEVPGLGSPCTVRSKLYTGWNMSMGYDEIQCIMGIGHIGEPPGQNN